MLKDLLQKVAAALDKLAVPYAVIGGLAVITRGVVRATKDVDFLVDWPVQRAGALAQSLTENGLPATFHRGDADDPLLYLERKAYLAAIGHAIGGVEAARVVLAKALARLGSQGEAA